MSANTSISPQFFLEEMNKRVVSTLVEVVDSLGLRPVQTRIQQPPEQQFAALMGLTRLKGQEAQARFDNFQVSKDQLQSVDDAVFFEHAHSLIGGRLPENEAEYFLHCSHLRIIRENIGEMRGKNAHPPRRDMRSLKAEADLARTKLLSAACHINHRATTEDNVLVLPAAFLASSLSTQVIYARKLPVLLHALHCTYRSKAELLERQSQTTTWEAKLGRVVGTYFGDLSAPSSLPRVDLQPCAPYAAPPHRSVAARPPVQDGSGVKPEIHTVPALKE